MGVGDGLYVYTGIAITAMLYSLKVPFWILPNSGPFRPTRRYEECPVADGDLYVVRGTLHMLGDVLSTRRTMAALTMETVRAAHAARHLKQQ